jgi:endoglucanase
MEALVLRSVLVAAVLALSAVVQAAEEPPRVGDVVFQTDFENQQSRDAWSARPVATWVPVEGQGNCLKVEVPADKAKDTNMVQFVLDVSRFGGCQLLFECRAKADAVTKPSASYLGVKFMCHYVSPQQGPVWRNQSDVYGTFDWKPLRFSLTIPKDVKTADLSLGLQDCSGTAWFDDLKITVTKLPPPPRPKPMLNPPPAFRGHDLPRLRGVMSPNVFRDEDMRVLGQEWKANVIRWQITRNWAKVGTDRDLVEYDKWLNGRLDELDQALEACRRYGLRVVVDMHSPPGGRLEGSELAIFHEKKYADHWVELWQQIARRYKGNPVIWGYDLVNEPVQNIPSPEGVDDYLQGQVRVARAIREIDPDMPIFIESNQWDSAEGYRELQPVDVPKVIYQVHMYVPGEFTHQGVNDRSTGFTYPGVMNGVEWNKERLRGVLAPVREFQLAYNVHIYVGEFSAIRWAPGAAQYLSDCIDLFEEYGWDWTFHAYREWSGWSLEHGPDKDDTKPTAEPTERRKAVVSWFTKNVKPQFP